MARSAQREALIQELLDMQKKYMEIEKKQGVTMKEYYTADESEFLGQYRENYTRLASQLVDMAHAETGSRR